MSDYSTKNVCDGIILVFKELGKREIEWMGNWMADSDKDLDKNVPDLIKIFFITLSSRQEN